MLMIVNLILLEVLSKFCCRFVLQQKKVFTLYFYWVQWKVKPYEGGKPNAADKSKLAKATWLSSSKALAISDSNTSPGVSILFFCGNHVDPSPQCLPHSWMLPYSSKQFYLYEINEAERYTCFRTSPNCKKLSLKLIQLTSLYLYVFGL